MKILSIVLTGLWLSFSFGCNSPSTNVDLKRQPDGNVAANTQNTNNSKSKTKEFTLASDNLKVKMPCDFSNTNETNQQSVSGKERTLEFNCQKGDVKFAFSSIKADFSLEDKFLKIKGEKGAKEVSVNNLPAIDNVKDGTSTTITSAEGMPDVRKNTYVYSKNRVYKLNDKWLVKFNVGCSSAQEHYCEDVFSKDAKDQIEEFLNFIEILK